MSGTLSRLMRIDMRPRFARALGIMDANAPWIVGDGNVDAAIVI